MAELEKLCALQCTDEDLAAFFGVTVRTIERRRQKPSFAAAMESGRAKGRLSVRRSLFAQANNGNTAASIFLAKNLLGYRDVRSNQHSGPDGGPIAIQNGLDLTRLSPEDGRTVHWTQAGEEIYRPQVSSVAHLGGDPGFVGERCETGNRLLDRPPTAAREIFFLLFQAVPERKNSSDATKSDHQSRVARDNQGETGRLKEIGVPIWTLAW